MTEPQDAYEWQRNYESKLAEIEQRNERMQEEVEGIQVTEQSSDGAISVTLNSQGHLIDLQLGDVLRRRDGKSVSQEILRLVSTAQGRIADKVQEAMEPYIGGTQAMDHVMGKLRSVTPTEPREQAAPANSSAPPPQQPSRPAGPPASGPPSAGSQGPQSGSQPQRGGSHRSHNPWDDEEDFSQGSFLE